MSLPLTFRECLDQGELLLTPPGDQKITHQLVVIEWFVVQVSSGEHFELSLADIDAVSHGSFSSLTRVRDVQ